jgi:hypothetical protein
MTDTQLTDTQMTDTQMTDIQLTDIQLTDTQMTDNKSLAYHILEGGKIKFLHPYSLQKFALPTCSARRGINNKFKYKSRC